MLDVRTDLENETVWLTQDDISLLFEKDQSVISRHITNIFNEGELEKASSMHFLHKSGASKNPNNRPPAYYNLDVVISVGYRVQTHRGHSLFELLA